MTEARKVGGSRRRNEAAVAVTYDIEGLQSVEQVRRLVEVAMFDTLALGNGVSRNRTLAYLAQTALKLLGVGEYEERMLALETALTPRLAKPVKPARRR